MSGDVSAFAPLLPDASDRAWHEIEALLEQLATLARAELSPTEFYGEFLGRVVSGLDAVGGVIWTQARTAGLRPECRIIPPEAQTTEDHQCEAQRHRLATMVLASGKPKLLVPRSTGTGDDPWVNPSDFMLLLCPWSIGEESSGVVEVMLRSALSPAAQRQHAEFLEAVCELVADFHRRRALREYRERLVQNLRLEEFSLRVHGSLDVVATAYTIANEARRLIGCDRVSVLVRRANRSRLLAVSGVDVPQRRATMVRHLERLCDAVVRLGEPLWHPEVPAQRPPQLEELLNAHLDESHARALAVLPLRVLPTEPAEPSESPPGTPGDRGRLVGALVAERFYGGLDDKFRGQVSAVVGHSAAALRNALEWDRVPLRRLWHALGKARWLVEARQLPKTALILLAIVAVAGALWLVPAELRIEARGELHPVCVRDVFAPADGVVAELRASHGQRVSAGQVLLVLHRPELDYEFQRLRGELQTARKKLASVEMERIQNPREDDQQRQRYSQLTAQQEELRELTKSLESQEAILRLQQAELEVRSPIDGEVLTWNLQQLLAARPVSRGLVLMTVADLGGPWRLELRIADRRVAHVLAAQQQLGENLEVSYVLATEPALRRRGTLGPLAARTEVTEAEGAFVLAHVQLDRDEIGEPIPGTTATAWIHCGRRSIGYVWLHDVVDAIRSWLFF